MAFPRVVRWLWSGFAVAVVAGLLPAATRAATITVTTTSDEVMADGNCSLREAIIAFNSGTAGPGGDCVRQGSGSNDVVQLPTGTYKLTLPANNAGDGSGGALLITAPLSLMGAGAATTTIQQTTGVDRVITSTGSGAAISGVKITGGGSESPTTLMNGAGLYNQGANASLTLTSVTVSGNHADGMDGSSGAGIYNTGTLAIEGSAVTANDATAGQGDGVYTDGGPVTIDNSTITGNGYATDGGGIYQAGGGLLTITNSSISDNGYSDTSSGGGLSLHGPARLTDDTITGNDARTEGGGIYAAPPPGSGVTLTDSTVSGNNLDGGPAYGAGIAATGKLTLTDSTVSGNDADTYDHSGGSGAVGDGGGVYFSAAAASETLDIAGSTIGPGNLATNGAGLYLAASGPASQSRVSRSTIAANGDGNPAGLGGGVYVGAGATASLHDVTLARNEANASDTGGGNLYAENGAGVTWQNTLVAQAFGGGNCDPAGGITATFTSLGGNEEYGDPQHLCGFTAAGDTQNTNDLTSSQLLNLANNGGPTETMALAPGSPPVDTGSGCLATDQRGVPRPQGRACDSGAYELDVTPLRVKIKSGPGGATSSRKVSFAFTANQPASFDCKLDNGTLQPCSSPFKAGPLGLGRHTFTVEGTDIPGHRVTVSRAFTIVVQPTVRIVTPAARASYAKGRAVDASYSCKAGTGTTLRSCTGTVANRQRINTSALGTHEFTVRATDRDGGTTIMTVKYTVRRT